MANKDANKNATGAQNTGQSNGTTNTGNPPDIVSMFQDDGADMSNGDPIPSEAGAPADTQSAGGNGAQGAGSETLSTDPAHTAGNNVPQSGTADDPTLLERLAKLEAENAALRGRTNDQEKVSQALPGRDKVQEKSADDIQVFHQWKMEPVIKQMNIVGQGVKDVLTGYKPVQKVGKTEIPRRIADTLNQQTPNNMTHYFLEGQEKFLDAENYF